MTAGEMMAASGARRDDQDDQDALPGLLVAGAGRRDAIVASGGASTGDHDVLKHAALALLGERRVPASGLPGNPVAALVTCELYVRPARRAMAGCPVPGRPRLAAIAETDLPRAPGPKLQVARLTARTGPGGVLRVRPSGSLGPAGAIAAG